MRWSDVGIVLAARRHGERGLLVHLLTQEHGRHAGLVRGGQGPKTRVLYQLCNRVSITWSARLAEHLGSYAGELVRGHAARFMDDRARLACLAAAAAMAETTLPEREPHPRIYAGLSGLLDALDADGPYAGLYVRWELDLLAELGYGLDLSRCAATGRRDDLTYISPKSGQAVSTGAAAPYRDKMLKLPAFLRDGESEAEPSEVLDGLRLTGFFLDRHVFDPHDRKLPVARGRFVDAIKRKAAVSSAAIGTA